MIIHDNGKLNFIIAIYHSLDEDMTGGSIVLHKLAYELAVRDFNVYIFTEPAFKHENIKVIHSEYHYQNGKTNLSWDNFSYPINNTIAIYPQTILGNPFNCKHVVRWILYHTTEEIEKTFSDNDIYFYFGDFKTFRNVEKKTLTIFEYNLDKLYQENFGKRDGFCHILHKHTPKNSEEILEVFNSKSLNEFENTKRLDFDFLKKELNKYEYFLTFDKKSYYTLSAILCGCKAIILDTENYSEFQTNAFSLSEDYQKVLTPTEYRINNPIQMFGVAYGLNDISWANETIKFAKQHLIEMDKIDKKTVDYFVDFWQHKIYGTKS